MYKRMGIKKLGRKKAHRESLIRNQMRGLFTTGALRTTTPKAKVMKSKAQSLIAQMKKEEITLERRRRLQTMFGNTELVQKAIKYSKKTNTGVSIVKVGFRAGDNAEMSRIELIGFKTKKKTKKVVKKEEEVKDIVDKDINKDIAKRKVSKIRKTKVRTVKKERAKSRSGL